MNAHPPRDGDSLSLSLTPVNANVFGVYTGDGAHVGNLKRIGTLWKFKAIGYEASGDVVPGGGPLTDFHNTPFTAPDVVALNAAIGVGINIKVNPNA